MNQDGDSATAIVDGETYTTPFSACPGEGGGDTSTSAGAGLMIMGYYAGVVVAAFVGML